MLVSLAILSVMMACEKGSGSGDEPELDLSPEEAMFLGYWINNASSSSKYYPNIYMSKDGRCFLWAYRTGVLEGNWSYDSEEKVLTTTIDKWRFEVMQSEEDAWTAIYFYENEEYVQSFRKASIFETFCCLTQTIKPCSEALCLMEFEENNNVNDSIFFYSLKIEESVELKGRVSMKNPHNLSKTEFTFSGDVEFTAKHSNIMETDVNVDLKYRIEAVDLGLSVKWADCNLGDPSNLHFGWGCLMHTYNNGKNSYFGLSAADQKLGDISGSIRDAARMNWGGNWRMPTKSEWDELIEQCTWTWMEKNGRNGYEVKSKKNGNSIFLPANGYRDASSEFKIVGDNSYGRYWSSKQYSLSFAYAIRFENDEFGFSKYEGEYLYHSCSVRPVCD